ncbi:variable surface lipoprotein, partial [Mycoplasmopsis bovis]
GAISAFAAIPMVAATCGVSFT